MRELTKAQVADLARQLASAGFEEDVSWSEGVEPPSCPDDFASEAIFVICNSGMKNTVARGIYERVMTALDGGGSAHDAFGHKGKAQAIDDIWRKRGGLYAGYMALSDDLARLDFLAALPWIGGITKYHLAKNFAVDVAKPDVHLQRVADWSGESVQGMCERLGAELGWKARTVDLVIWRACAIGLVDSRSLTPAGRAALQQGEGDA